METVVNRTGLSRWQVIALITVLVFSIAVLCSWCFWRFFKKKRPKGTAEMEDDEKDLVGNEEEVAEEIEDVQQNTDYKGKIHYRLEYDFTTQELKVTVSCLKFFSFLFRSFEDHRVQRAAADRLVHRTDGPLCQGLPSS